MLVHELLQELFEDRVAVGELGTVGVVELHSVTQQEHVLLSIFATESHEITNVGVEGSCMPVSPVMSVTTWWSWTFDCVRAFCIC